MDGGGRAASGTAAEQFPNERSRPHRDDCMDATSLYISLALHQRRDLRQTQKAGVFQAPHKGRNEPARRRRST
jgi:hypothetical protein